MTERVLHASELPNIHYMRIEMKSINSFWLDKVHRSNKAIQDVLESRRSKRSMVTPLECGRTIIWELQKMRANIDRVLSEIELTDVSTDLPTTGSKPAQ